jgi:hypothetical protein
MNLGVVAALIAASYILGAYPPAQVAVPEDMRAQSASAASTASVSSPFHYHFRVSGVLQESASMNESSSPYFWLNSGGQLILENGRGETVQGKLLGINPWRLLYAVSNALDTDGGYQPQNIFRLVTRSVWDDFAQSIRFRIEQINLTDTPNRDGYSGVLLMTRYQDGDNLYYAGIRMDGLAVIKKKYRGTYYTLASERVFNGDYDKWSNPNLIPEDHWMRIRTTTQDLGGGRVGIALWLDEDDNGSYRKIAETVDVPGTNGNDTISGPAHAGVRTDYLDALFDDYHIEKT